MYIPYPPRESELLVPTAARPAVGAAALDAQEAQQASSASQRAARAAVAAGRLLHRTALSLARREPRELEKRQDAGLSTDVTVGIVVAVVLAAFLGLLGWFLWSYRFSLTFRPRRKRRRHHGHRKSTSSSKSSKASSDGGGGNAPAPAPPPPPPPAADPPAE